MHIRHEGKVFSKESLIEAFLSFDNREPDKCLSKWSELAKWLENNKEMPRELSSDHTTLHQSKQGVT